MSPIKDAIIRSNQAGRAALIPFVMAAMPDEDRCIQYIKALEEGGCDVLELGVPYSDPLADGEIIQKFHYDGVDKGLNLAACMDFIERVRSQINIPIVLFSYYNPIFRMGIDEFNRRCQELKIDGLVIPDLPFEESQGLKTTADLVPMVAPSTRPERMKILRSLDPAFVYCVSVRGVTGVRNALPASEIKAYMNQVREYTNAPLAMGFGISGPEVVAQFKDIANAFVVGSLFSQMIAEGQDDSGLPGRLAETARELKEASRK